MVEEVEVEVVEELLRREEVGTSEESRGLQETSSSFRWGGGGGGGAGEGGGGGAGMREQNKRRRRGKGGGAPLRSNKYFPAEFPSSHLHFSPPSGHCRNWKTTAVQKIIRSFQNYTFYKWNHTIHRLTQYSQAKGRGPKRGGGGGSMVFYHTLLAPPRVTWPDCQSEAGPKLGPRVALNFYCVLSFGDVVAVCQQIQTSWVIGAGQHLYVSNVCVRIRIEK